MSLSTAVHITEARPLAATSGGPRELEIQLIDPGWGSSGYYSVEVLEQAAKDRIFPAGTHMYADHPTDTEETERPERSIRDLVAVTTEDAHVGAGGALVARAKPFAGWGTALREMKDSIGVSIRAGAMVSQGEADGRRGLIVDRLVEGVSVDFVTKAGRGGKILEVLESARAPAREAHGMTANDLRDALCAAVKDAYGGENTWTWVRDYTDEWVVYSVETPDSEELYQHPYSVAAGAVSLGADRSPVMARTSYVPAPEPTSEAASVAPVPLPPAATTVRVESLILNRAQLAETIRQAIAAEHSKPTTTKNVTADAPSPAPTPTTTEESMGQPTGTPPGSEAGPAEVTEAATRKPISEAEVLAQRLAERTTQVTEALQRADLAEKRAAAAEQRATLVEAKWAAEKRTKVALTASPLKEASYQSVIDAVADSLVVDESGKVDDAKVDEAIKAEIDREQTKVAALLEAHGVGVPRGLGGTGQPTQVTEAQFQNELAGVFGDLGMDETSAKLAAKGR